MSVISDLITEIRMEVGDPDSTRFSDTQIITVIKKAVRRANRIAQRNALQFAKKKADLVTVAGQDYVLISGTSDFDVIIGLWRTDTHEPIAFATESEWERIISCGTLARAVFDYSNDKILLKDTPSSVLTLHLWYYPVIDVSAYTAGSTCPWNGKLDDIIMEYTENRLKNIDEMDIAFDIQLMTDMENQILQAYAPNGVTMSEGSGWLQG